MGLVRLFLALVVAADHWRILKLAPFALPFEDYYKLGFNSGYAVMFFYTVSGFLITYTLVRNYSRDIAGIRKFYVNRFIRIFSLYWPLVIVSFVLVDRSWTTFLSWSLPDKLTGIFLLGMDWRLSFASYPIPHFEAAIPGLEQAWTLGAELTFYLAAPLLLRSWKIAAALMVASFALRAGFVIANGTQLQQIWTYHFVGTTFGFFMLGHLVCLVAQRWRALLQPMLGFILLLCSFATMAFGGSYANYDTARFWGAALFFTFALPGLFEGTKNIAWMNAAGDLSYPIYLVHTLVLYVAGQWLLDCVMPSGFLSPLVAGFVTMGAFLLLCMLAAALVHKLIEAPAARMMHYVARKAMQRSAHPPVAEKAG
jgi:peptidoglycan/LPS O-acetylase OafA/YrhL